MEKKQVSDSFDDPTLQLFVELEQNKATAKSLHDYISVAHQALKRRIPAENMTVILFADQSSSIICEYYQDNQQQHWREGQQIMPSALSKSALSVVIESHEGFQLNAGQPSQHWHGDVQGHCWMAVPLFSLNNDCIGAVSVHSYGKLSHFSHQDFNVLRLVGSYFTNAIASFRNKQNSTMNQSDRTALLERELREKEKAEKLQRALYQIATLVTQELALNELYQHLHAIIAELLYAKNFFIAMLDEQQRHLTFSYFIDEKDGFETEHNTVEVGRGLTSYVVKTKSSQLLTPSDVQTLIEQDEIDQVLGSSDFSCWMGSPLITNSKVHGIIVLQSYESDIVYNDADLQLLNFVATHVATAIELSMTAQLRRESQRKLELKHQQISQTLAELKATQKELIQKEKMASLGALVAGIAHEINTPLGICVTGVSHLAEEYRYVKKAFDDNKLTKSIMVDFFESVEESTAILTSNTNRAADLVQSFKQVAVDQSSGNVRKFKLAHYIDEIILSMRPTLKKHDHKVAVNCDENIVVKVNAGAISQILTNLIVNSVRHGFEDSFNGKIVIDVIEADGSIHLSYKDYGRGVSDEHMKKLFEPFFTTQRGRGGSGLGTHLVYNLVTSALYGDVKANSEPGEGLQYIISFPANSELVN